MLNRVKGVISTLLLVISDLIAFLISIYLSVYESSYLNSLYLFLIILVVFSYEKLYVDKFQIWSEIKTIIKSIGITVAIALIISSLNERVSELSICELALFFILSTISISLLRFLTKKALLKASLYQTNLIIIGDCEDIENLIEDIEREFNLGYKIVGFFSISKPKKEIVTIGKRSYRVFDSYEKIPKYLKRLNIQGAIVSSRDSERKRRVVESIQHYIREIFIIPNSKTLLFLNSSIEYFFEYQSILIKLENNFIQFRNIALKRIFDISLALIVMPIVLPTILVIAIAIRISTKSNALFIQERLGKEESKFNCIKFQTMRESADSLLDEFFKQNPEELEHWRVYKKIKGDDPRVTKIGKFLRKTSLDELPQIFNILKGEMSFVGPRPYLERELEDMQGRDYIIRLAKPGITGMWQVMGRNAISFDRRTEIEEWYVRNWSLWLDIVLLLKTISVVLFRKGAY